MTTIQEIRDALKEYDSARENYHKHACADDPIRLEALEPLERWRSNIAEKVPDYIRTLLGEIERVGEANIDQYLNERHCCSGHDCGCGGVSRLEQLVYEESGLSVVKLRKERDALRAEVERLKSRIEWFRIQSGQHALSPMSGTFQPKDTAPDSSGVDPLLNKPITTSP